MGLPWNEINRRLEMGFEDIEGGEIGYLPAGLLPTNYEETADPLDPTVAKNLAFGQKQDNIPPQSARAEAERGLEWRREYNRGGTEVGVARARDIANGANLSDDTIGRMVSYFARHEVDKQATGWNPGEEGYPSAGRIAWALWSGDPGRAWAEKRWEQIQAKE
jgi:hypothetical protein